MTASVAIFDFDGTVSLIRAGWMDVMMEMMLEILLALPSNEPESELRARLEHKIWINTGKDTVHQMYALADEVVKRGGTPLSGPEYKDLFAARLSAVTDLRKDELRRGLAGDRYLVPGTAALLHELRGRGVTLYLASGTDEPAVKEEAGLLGVSQFFEDRIFGARNNSDAFSKEALLTRLITSSAIDPKSMVGFGDGYVETEVVSRLGGRAIGVAGKEPHCLTLDPWKQERLLAAGAEFVIPNFTGFPAWLG